MMEWSRSDIIALAMQSCSQCHGLGLRTNLNGQTNPCNCVLRAVFRACYARFRHCVAKEKNITRVSPEMVAGKDGRMVWGRKDEEYIADFCLVSRRALAGLDYRVFKYHFLLGADWRLCTKKLNMDRGDFFHAVYRVEHQLGRVFRELKPYGLYPLRDYFQGVRAMPAREVQELDRIPPGRELGPAALRPPVLQIA
jgi:hypothetical protein